MRKPKKMGLNKIRYDSKTINGKTYNWDRLCKDGRKLKKIKKEYRKMGYNVRVFENPAGNFEFYIRRSRKYEKRKHYIPKI